MPDRHRIAAAALAALLATGAPALADDRYWNPRPDAADVTLPMPCGAGMVFRKVFAGAAKDRGVDLILEDQRAILGSGDGIAAEGAEQSAARVPEYSRVEHVAGPFFDEDEQRRYFLIAKYEVSGGQWNAVMSGGATCPEGALEDRVPKSDISWYDAVEFTRRYSAWLYENHFDDLPRAEATPGFVRLPTETEWEFAARGGSAVDEPDFKRNIPFPVGRLQNHAWYNDGSDELQVIGAVDIEPNQLGLFDILGNVSEMVLDSFRLNRAGRPHGLAGGFVAKGGSIRTPLSQMRSSLREEYSYFNSATRTESKSPYMGFRPVFAGVVLASREAFESLQTAWNQAVQGSTVVAEEDRPVPALERLANETADPALRQGLENVKRVVTNELARRNELESRMLRNLLFSLTSMHANMLDLRRDIDRSNGIIENYRRMQERGDHSRARDLEVEIRRNLQRNNDALFDYNSIGIVYIELMTQIVGEDYRDKAEFELRTLYADLLSKNRRSLADNVPTIIVKLRDAEKLAELSEIERLEYIFGPIKPVLQ